MLTNEELMAINGYSEDDLEHYGVLGMKWGIRRYQNKDGSLTSAGKARYGDKPSFMKSKNKKPKVEKPPKTDAEIKEEIMRNPTAKSIKEYRHLFTTSELKDLSEREKAVSSIVSSQNVIKSEKSVGFKRSLDIIDTFSKFLIAGGALASTVIVGKQIIDILKGSDSQPVSDTKMTKVLNAVASLKGIKQA